MPPEDTGSQSLPVLQHCRDQGDRLREVEDTMRDLSTIKKLVGAILVLGLPAVGSGLYQNVVNATQQHQLETQVAAHEVTLAKVTSDIGEIRTDVRVLITEFRAAEEHRQERDTGISERLTHLEATTLTTTTPRR